MYQAVVVNDFCSRVAENGKLSHGGFVESGAGAGLVVHTDAEDAGVELVEVGFMLRELAQFFHAEGSPIAAVKIEQNLGAAQTGEGNGVAALVVEGKVGCRGSGDEGGLGRGRALGGNEIQFSGQVAPNRKLIRYHIDIKRLVQRALVMGIADARMEVDGEMIYQGSNLRVGLFTEI